MVIRGVGELWRVSWSAVGRVHRKYLSGPETSVRKCPLPVIMQNTCVSKKDLHTTSRASRRARGGSRRL